MPSFGDIAQVAGKRRRSTQGNARDCKLDGKFRAVGTDGRQLDALPKHACLAGREVALKAASVRLSKCRRDDDVRQFPAYDLVATISEDALGGRIELGDAPCLIHRENAV